MTLGIVRHHLKVYATDSITINSITGEDNAFVINYKKVPIVLRHLEYLDEDIDEQRYLLDEAKRQREEEVPKISKRIVAMRDEIEEIKHSSFNATVVIKHTVHGLNTITFALPKNKEITYRTREGMSYEPFFLEVHEEYVTLQPVGVSVSL